MEFVEETENRSISPPVVLLCGGLGLRQRSDGDDLPKVLRALPDGRPLLLHIIESYRRFGLREFVLCVGYGADSIRDCLSDAFPSHDPATSGDDTSKSTSPGVSITVVDSGPNATKTLRILDAMPHVGERAFLLGYGDVLSDIDLRRLIADGNAAPGVLTVAVTRVRSRYGVLVVDESMAVRDFREKPLEDALISAGYFMCDPDIFGFLATDTNADTELEDNVLPSLVRFGKVHAFVHDGIWLPFDTYKDFIEVEAFVKERGYPWLALR